MGFAPHAVLLTWLCALLRAHAFSGRGQWVEIVPQTLAGTATSVLVIGAGAAVLGLVLHPFQIRAVRLFEGYWDRWTLTARLADVLIGHQRRRWRAIDARARGTGRRRPRRDSGSPMGDGSARERVRANAEHRLAALPPLDVLLPTALGNALRAGELRAGERYGLATLASWPRIYPQLSRPLASAVGSARDTLDTSVNLSYSFLACALVSAAAVYDEPGMWWLPAASLGAAALSYKGAVTAAQGYAHLMHIVYDLLAGLLAAFGLWRIRHRVS
ncbi:hypothetical protein [Actinomadura physcomitrii]|uniref:hypothetical protein n=1 Tax=Actinomadura physcomitrii TaxID=2650748 RepID=UPI00136B3C3C|nr:hypothetical protein [Actinomadura physcomitrii]